MTKLVTRTVIQGSLTENTTAEASGDALTHAELDKNFYPLAITTNGIAEANKALVVDGSKGITGIGALSASSLTSTGAVTGATINGTTLQQGGVDLIRSGTWTPALTFSITPPGTITYSIQNGWYQRIGSVVHVGGLIDILSYTAGAANGILRLTGLPFASNATLFSVLSVTADNIVYSTSASGLGARLNASTASADIFANLSSAGRDFFTPTDISSTTNIWFHGSYIAA